MQCLNAKPPTQAAFRSIGRRSPTTRVSTQIAVAQRHSTGAIDVFPATFKASAFLSPALVLSGATALLSPMLLDVPAALAKDGEFGLLEGTSAALVHPAMMFTLLAASGYAGYLGFQWRRTREIGDEIRELRKSQTALADGAAAAAAENPAIAVKEKERKELLSGNFKDKHSAMGSLILAAGTGIAIEGCVNTFMRTEKLFPGPHLFIGAGMVAVWALAAALVPEMQKGNDNARSAHIALNVVNTLLFVSQVPTGLEIVGKVFQFTHWP